MKPLLFNRSFLILSLFVVITSSGLKANCSPYNSAIHSKNSLPYLSSGMHIDAMLFQDQNHNGILEKKEQGYLKFKLQNLSNENAINVSVLLSGEGTSHGIRSKKELKIGYLPAKTQREIRLPLLGTESLLSGEALLKITCFSDSHSPVDSYFKLLTGGLQNTASNKHVTLKSSSAVEKVRFKIPDAITPNPNAIAVVIGNKHYAHADVPNVEFALNDSRAIKSYLLKAYGFKEENILYLENATMGNFISVFGNAQTYKGRLHDLIKPNVSDVFIYYSGHGAPDLSSREVGKKAFMVPVDCDPNMVNLNGYSMGLLYKNLAALPFRTLSVVVDACFSGGTSNNQMLIKNASPVFIKVNHNIEAHDNVSIICAATETQVASWHREAEHSLMTYHLLKGLSSIKQHPQNLTFKELSSYIQKHVEIDARRLYGREQTPIFKGEKERPLIGKRVD